MDKEDVLYQHGTLALLVPGLFKGTLTVGELLKHGDYGIGSVQGLDGELTVVDSKGYLVKSDGSVVEVADDETVPFANMHYDRVTDKYDRKDITRNALDAQILKHHDYNNIFFALKITGTFASIKTRVVNGNRKPPYKTLAQTATDQSIFEDKDVKGTLVGYYSPELFQGIASAGYHVHFISDDHTFGGHVLDYKLAEGQVNLQRFESLDLHLPVHDSTYRKYEFDYNETSDIIKSAEGNNN